MDPDQPDVPAVPVQEEQDTAPDAAVEEAPESPDQPTETATEDAPAAEAGTSDTEGAEGDSFTDVDTANLPEEVQARYRQMQADYTKKTQELASQRSEVESAVNLVSDLVAEDPSDDQKAVMEQVFQHLAGRLGVELEGFDDVEDEGKEGEQPDEPEVRDPRVDALLAEREEERQRKAQAEYEADLDRQEQEIEDGLKALAKDDGLDLDDDEVALLFDKVLALPPVDGEKPDIKGAYNVFRNVLKRNQQRWIDSKKADSAPKGEAGEPKPNLNNEDDRIAYMARVIDGVTGRQDQ